MAVHLFYSHRFSCKREETKRLILTDFFNGFGVLSLSDCEKTAENFQ